MSVQMAHHAAIHLVLPPAALREEMATFLVVKILMVMSPDKGAVSDSAKKPTL